jgi:hypothetical protein
MNVGHREVFTLRAANFRQVSFAAACNRENPCGDFLEIQFRK